MYQSLEQAMNTKAAVVISTVSFDHKGSTRNWIKVRKANGKKEFRVTQYENGLYSSAV
jgi:hypothetical protein